eukprot:TRINITY_DN44432_c0_g1_i1.p2 TRINITY_DN44432_c0_g1~~TRINITY_DN44432_c0_g1_i1.p2  ORF type:complete len:105 (+),score=15.08 TRINITY_DN44432_c0_g1_i1:264-578(+)
MWAEPDVRRVRDDGRAPPAGAGDGGTIVSEHMDENSTMRQSTGRVVKEMNGPICRVSRGEPSSKVAIKRGRPGRVSGVDEVLSKSKRAEKREDGGAFEECVAGG